MVPTSAHAVACMKPSKRWIAANVGKYVEPMPPPSFQDRLEAPESAFLVHRMNYLWIAQSARWISIPRPLRSGTEEQKEKEQASDVAKPVVKSAVNVGSA